MALSEYVNRVDEHGREMLEHGTALFPIACYHDDLRWEDIPWHWHDELEAFVVTKGSALSETDTQRVTLRKGQGCLINVNVLHAQKNMNPGGDCRFHSMCLQPRLAGGGTESIYWEKYIRPVTENDSFRMITLDPGNPLQASILEHIENAWQCCVHEPENYEIRVRYEISMLFAEAGKLMPLRKGKTLHREAVREERMKLMLQFIRDHLREELMVADIAAAASISESECLRSFRDIIRVSPIRYVQQLRLQKAADLLSHTDVSVSKIGEECGFMDMSYFARVFRAGYGITPSQYRKNKQVPDGS